jgi:hypothetical protein
MRDVWHLAFVVERRGFARIQLGERSRPAPRIRRLKEWGETVYCSGERCRDELP